MNNYFYKLILLLLLTFSAGIVYSETQTNLFPISSAISSGVIKTIHVTEGQTVKKGDLLFEFDDRLINSNLEEAQANVRMASLKASEAKKEVERSVELYERTLLSDYDLQQSRVKYREAQAELAQAKNKLVHVQWDKDYSKVYAPFNARVKTLKCYTGCYVNNNFSTQTILFLEKKVK